MKEEQRHNCVVRMCENVQFSLLYIYEISFLWQNATYKKLFYSFQLSILLYSLRRVRKYSFFLIIMFETTRKFSIKFNVTKIKLNPQDANVNDKRRNRCLYSLSVKSGWKKCTKFYAVCKSFILEMTLTQQNFILVYRF